MKYVAEFEYTLQDGRQIEVEASDFSEDRSVGLELGPEFIQFRRTGTGFSVGEDSVADRDFDAILTMATDYYLSATDYDDELGY